MKCPKCKTEARIGSSRYVISGDKLFLEQDFYCRNKNCNNNGQVIDTDKTELPVSNVGEAP